MLSWEWRCSWSSGDRRCSNYIWVINNFITYWGVTYIRGFTVVLMPWALSTVLLLRVITPFNWSVVRTNDMVELAYRHQQTRLFSVEVIGLLLVWYQTIIWNNANLLSIESRVTNFSKIKTKVQQFSFKKMKLEMSSANRWLFHHSLNELTMIQIMVGCLKWDSSPNLQWY